MTEITQRMRTGSIAYTQREREWVGGKGREKRKVRDRERKQMDERGKWEEPGKSGKIPSVRVPNPDASLPSLFSSSSSHPSDRAHFASVIYVITALKQTQTSPISSKP